MTELSLINKTWYDGLDVSKVFLHILVSTIIWIVFFNIVSIGLLNILCHIFVSYIPVFLHQNMNCAKVTFHKSLKLSIIETFNISKNNKFLWFFFGLVGH